MIDSITIREARITDIPVLHYIRMNVKENVLSNPLLVQEKDYYAFITSPNKGWAALQNGRIIGFAIVDVNQSNIWALFVDPAYEGHGAGRLLHAEMISWYFRNHSGKL